MLIEASTRDTILQILDQNAEVIARMIVTNITCFGSYPNDGTIRCSLENAMLYKNEGNKCLRASPFLFGPMVGYFLDLRHGARFVGVEEVKDFPVMIFKHSGRFVYCVCDYRLCHLERSLKRPTVGSTITYIALYVTQKIYLKQKRCLRVKAKVLRFLAPNESHLVRSICQKNSENC